MSADTAAVLLVLAAAPAQTLFAIVYGVGSPWWRSLVGRALFTKALALALLIDISLLYHWLGDDYALRDVVRLTVYGLIAVGAWMQFVALLVEKYKGRRDDADRFSRPDTPRHP
jgi:hypothetical protein